MQTAGVPCQAAEPFPVRKTARAGAAAPNFYLDSAPAPAVAAPAVRPTVIDRKASLTGGLFGKRTPDTFNTDYKTRPASAPAPPFLQGCGLQGKNIPIGQEDAYRQCLPDDYMPTDLVQLSREHCYYNMVLYLRREPADALMRMFGDAQKQGLHLEVFSAFRDIQHQRRLYSESISRGNRGSVAKPGYSEHMLGTTVDITNNEKHLMRRSFQDTAEGRWLARNAARYGWKATVVSGSGSRSHVDEPWHLRYFGPGRIPAGRPSSLNTASTPPNVPARFVHAAENAAGTAARAVAAPVRAGGGMFSRMKDRFAGRQ